MSNPRAWMLAKPNARARVTARRSHVPGPHPRSSIRTECAPEARNAHNFESRSCQILRSPKAYWLSNAKSSIRIAIGICHVPVAGVVIRRRYGALRLAVHSSRGTGVTNIHIHRSLHRLCQVRRVVRRSRFCTIARVRKTRRQSRRRTSELHLRPDKPASCRSTPALSQCSSWLMLSSDACIRNRCEFLWRKIKIRFIADRVCPAASEFHENLMGRHQNPYGNLTASAGAPPACCEE